MVAAKTDTPDDKGLSNPPVIVAWTRKYARNRAAPTLARFVVFAAIFLAMGLPGRLARDAAATGHPNLSIFWFGLSFLAAATLVVLVVTGAGRTAMRKLEAKASERFYRGEGQVRPEGMSEAMRPPGIGKHLVLGLVFASAVLGSIYLRRIGLVPPEYTQPLSAIYGVPFLVYLNWRYRKVRGLLPMLWPILYSLHALLVLAGVPGLSDPQRAGLNMFVSTFGYGVLTFLVSHFYSRYAVARLKKLARADSRAG